MSIGLASAVVHPRTKRMIVVISEQCAIDAGNAATWHECVERRTKTLIGGNKANALSQDPQESSEDCEALYTLTAHQVTDSAHIKPILRQISWKAVPLTMLVDTGSPVSVIPGSVLERHRGKWPHLQATTMKLSCFKGPLPINGKLQLNATMSGATIKAELFVIDCPGPMLCGRDTICSFNTAGVPVLTGNEVASVQAKMRTEWWKPRYQSTVMSLLRGWVCSKGHRYT
ncbi:hypothetical protein MRX96_020268 [Rhipicephalus microplus]